MIVKNKLITVHFPNGKSRIRNVQSTEIPEGRYMPQRRFDHHKVLHSTANSALFLNNRFKMSVDELHQDYKRKTRNENICLISVAAFLTICLLIIAFG